MDFYSIISQTCVEMAFKFLYRQSVTNDLTIDNALSICIRRLKEANEGNKSIALSCVANDIAEYAMVSHLVETLNYIEFNDMPREVQVQVLRFGLWVKPIYKHDSEDGDYIGKVMYKGACHDVWIHEDTLVARYSDVPSEYASLPLHLLEHFNDGKNGVLSLAYNLYLEKH